MSGHSKWATIKHKKALTDAKKGKVFSKYAKLIAVESRLAGGDVNAPSLRAIIEKAKGENMPKDNIERAVAKGTGGGQVDMTTITYELYGPGGVAILADTLTDNNNRTNQELKHLVATLGYQIANPGSATWAFVKEGATWTPTSTIPLSDEDAEKLAVLVEALEDHDDVQEVWTNAE